MRIYLYLLFNMILTINNVILIEETDSYVLSIIIDI